MSLASQITALAQRIAGELKSRPGQLIGTTAQRLAYPHTREGIVWFDTTLGFDVEYVGGVWRAQLPVTQRFNATVTPTTAWKSASFNLTTALDTARGVTGTIGADGVSSTSSMVVGTMHRYVPTDTPVLTSVTFRYASIPSNLGTATNVLFFVTGFPHVEQ
ncbi:hypothetical protein [Microbacterium sp. KNMS]